MPTKIIIVCFLCLDTLKMVAQDSFVPGHLYFNQSDTIKGWIAFEQDSQLYNQVKFKSSKSAEKVTVYTIDQLHGFRFIENGRVFRKFKVKNTKGDSIEVFAKKILEGQLETWIWRRPKGNPDFIIQNLAADKLVQLSFVEDVTVEKDGKTYKKKNMSFIQKLNYLTDGNLNLYLQNQHLKYSEEGILAFVKRFNLSKKNQYKTREHIDLIKTERQFFGGYAGFHPRSWGQLNFTLGYRNLTTNMEKNQHFSKMEGFQYSIFVDQDNFEQFIHYLHYSPLGYFIRKPGQFVTPYLYASLNAGLAIWHDSDGIFLIPLAKLIDAGGGIQIKKEDFNIFVEITRPGLFIPMNVNIGVKF